MIEKEQALTFVVIFVINKFHSGAEAEEIAMLL